MSLTKSLLLLGLAGLLAGCNLEITTPPGGSIKSESGLHDCSEASTCVIEVNNMNFNERFVAIPKPGYRFVKWQDGQYTLCSDSVNPVCIASAKKFKGNAVVESVIASNGSGYLKPVFERGGAPGYVLRDGDGNRLGDILSLNPPVSVTSRLVYTDSDEIDHGYAIHFVGKGEVYPSSSDLGYWSDSSCAGDPSHMRLDDDCTALEPLFSSKYRFMESSHPKEFHLVRVQPYQAELTELYRLTKNQITGADTCELYGGTQLYQQVAVEVRNFGSQFKPPFSLDME